jgi:glycosyltransferase involved in cell wall biosynthesis
VPRTIALVYGGLLHVGGVETHLLSLIRHSDRACYRWLVVAATSLAFAGRAHDLGATVVSWRPAHALDLRALLVLQRVLRARAADLVHVHSPRAALLGCLAGRALRRPTVVTVHLPAYYQVPGPGPGARLKRRLYQAVEGLVNRHLAERVIYVSHRVYAEALALGVASHRRSLVIENGIDLTQFGASDARAAVRSSLGTPPAAVVLCAVGRLDSQKGLNVLLDALARLPAGGWEAWLVGDGPLALALQAQAQRLGLASRVRFLGCRDDVPRCLQAADVFALPSRYEASSLAVLEAMAAGLPCVVTAVGDNPYLVQDRVTGYLVAPDDPSALAAALAGLLQQADRRREMGARARARARAFSDRELAYRVQRVYATLLDPPIRTSRTNGQTEYQ